MTIFIFSLSCVGRYGSVISRFSYLSTGFVSTIKNLIYVSTYTSVRDLLLICFALQSCSVTNCLCG